MPLLWATVTDVRVKIMANDYNYQRTGWNKRGPIVALQMENARYQSELLNPDSYYWQTRALDMKFWLIQKMGAQEFDEWADRLFPGYSIEEATWKEIHELYEAKFRVIQHDGECTCTPDSDACDVCVADNDKRYGNEIPIGG